MVVAIKDPGSLLFETPQQAEQYNTIIYLANRPVNSVLVCEFLDPYEFMSAPDVNEAIETSGLDLYGNELLKTRNLRELLREAFTSWGVVEPSGYTPAEWMLNSDFHGMPLNTLQKFLYYFLKTEETIDDSIFSFFGHYSKPGFAQKRTKFILSLMERESVVYQLEDMVGLASQKIFFYGCDLESNDYIKMTTHKKGENVKSVYYRLISKGELESRLNLGRYNYNSTNRLRLIENILKAEEYFTLEEILHGTHYKEDRFPAKFLNQLVEERYLIRYGSKYGLVKVSITEKGKKIAAILQTACDALKGNEAAKNQISHAAQEIIEKKAKFWQNSFSRYARHRR